MVTSRALAFALVLSLGHLGTAMADTGHAAVSCQIDSLPKTVTDAWAALKRSPDDLERQLAVAGAPVQTFTYSWAQVVAALPSGAA